jgi:hypothetical protein
MLRKPTTFAGCTSPCCIIKMSEVPPAMNSTSSPNSASAASASSIDAAS